MNPADPATPNHTKAAEIRARSRKSIIPLHAGIENTSKAARRLKSDIPPITCLSLMLNAQFA